MTFVEPVRRVDTMRYGKPSHHYVDGNGARIPGVTTILSGGMPKPALVGWGIRTVAEYAIDRWDELAGKLLVQPGTRELTGDRGLKRVGHISGAAGYVVRLDSPALLGCLGEVGMPTDRNRRQAHQRPLVAAPGWCRRRRRPPNQRARQPPGPVTSTRAVPTHHSGLSSMSSHPGIACRK